jgi:hypothetical protein
MIVRTYNLFLDSQYANTRTPSNDTRELTFYLKKAIEPMHPDHRFQVRVNTAEIPFSFSQVNPTNNSFAVEFGTFALGNATIPPGNYDIISLLASVDLAINALLVANGFIATLTSTFDQNTGKATFKFVSNGTGLKLYFGTTIILTMIGFDPVINGAFVSINGSASPGSTTSSVKNVNVCPTTCIYISSRSFTQTRNYEALTTGFDITDVIGKIQLTTLPQTYLMYINYTGEFVEVNNKVITEVNLYLSTNLVDSLAMQDMRWSIHLVVEEVKSPSPESLLGPQRNLLGLTAEGKDQEKSAVIDDLLQKKQNLINELQTFKKTLSALRLANDGGNTGNVDGED